MKKIFSQKIPLLAATVFVKDDSDSSKPTLVRRTELPIYSKPPVYTEQWNEPEDSLIYDGVKMFRAEGCKAVSSWQTVSERCSRFVNTGIAHASANYTNTVDYLREDGHVVARAGAIVGGALIGHLWAIRRGFIRRQLYTIVSGAAVASVCYPQEAKVYFAKSACYVRKYAVVGYHFLNGVAKDVGGFELPGLPLTASQNTSKHANQAETDGQS